MKEQNNYRIDKLPVSMHNLLFAVITIFFIIRGFLLVYPDLNLAYPFLFADSYDWIANGLHWAGYDVNFSFRTPALPLIISLLEKIGLLPFLPLLNQLVLFCILVTIFKILQRQFGNKVSILTTLVLFFNFFLQNISLYILADLYALLFIALGYYFYLKPEEERNYIFSALFFAISFLFQYAILFALPAFILHFIFFRKKANQKLLIQALLAFFLPISALLVFKRIKFGSFFYSGVNHFQLLKWHTDSIFFYFLNTISVFGIFVFLLTMIGIGCSVFIKNNRKKLEFLYLNLLGISFWILFWVFLYSWNDRRFILYALVFLSPFLAIGLEKLFINGFEKTNTIGKILLVGLFLLTLLNTSIPYETALQFNMLKITNNIAIAYKEIVDEKTSNGNIDETSFQIKRTAKLASPFDLKNLHSLKENISKNFLKESLKLREIKGELEKKEIKLLCVRYENKDLENQRWYYEKNRLGNFFKNIIKIYPEECSTPNLFIGAKSIEINKI